MTAVVVAAAARQGTVWLVVCACFAVNPAGFVAAMWWCAVAGLWYLPIGTLLSIVQLAVLHGQ